MACSGNLTEYCGGGSRLSVWSLKSYSNSSNNQPTTNTSSILSDATYMGCYSDGTSRSISGGYSGVQNMTLEICRTLAQNGNYKYFGLEYAGECYAGNNVTSSQIAAGNCNMACKGNTKQVCGGSSALSVYQNSKYVQATNSAVNISGTTFTYQGCYAEGASGRALGGTSSYTFTNDTMTIEMCASTCYSKGFTYIGTEFGKECYCNSAGIVNGGSVAANSDCNTACGGNKGQYCGGSKRLSVFMAKSGTRSMR